MSTNRKNLRKSRDEAKAQYSVSGSDEHKVQWRTLANETARLRQRDKTKYLETQCMQATTAAQNNNNREVYQVIRNITGKMNKKSVTTVNKRDHTAATDKAELLSEWRFILQRPCSTNSSSHSGTQPIPEASNDLPSIQHWRIQTC